MKLPEDLLVRPAEEAVRRICLHHLDDARHAVRRLKDPTDAEALHDFRVAVRRLRSIFRGFRKELRTIDKKHRNGLRKFQEATGRGRDAEVLLEWIVPLQTSVAEPHRLGFNWVVGRLDGEKTTGYAIAAKEIDKNFEKLAKKLHRRLERMDFVVHLRQDKPQKTFAEVLAVKLRTHVGELTKRLEGATSIDELEQAHQARIACKRLRYLVDPVRPYLDQAKAVSKRCKALQDVLGDLNDAEVLRGYLDNAEVEATEVRAQRLHDVALSASEPEIAEQALLSERAGVVELNRRLRIHLEQLFSTLQTEWRIKGMAELAKESLTLADQLEALAHDDTEVERKFLLSALPDRVRDLRPDQIDQGWLPGQKIHERLRRITHSDETIRYRRTIKLGRGIRRAEYEESIDASLFVRMWPLTEGCRVSKRRYKIQDGDLTWELDDFSDRKLFLAEVELPSETHPLTIPEWLGPLVVREVTGEAEYVNLNLAQ